MKYFILFVIVVLALAGLAYYFLVYVPQQKEKDKETETGGTGTSTDTTPPPPPPQVISLGYGVGNYVADKNDGMLYHDLYGNPTTITKNKYQSVGTVMAMDNIWTKVDILFGRGGANITAPFTQRNYLVKKEEVIKIQQ